MIYAMLNCFAWGIMKAYINSHNCVSKDKLVMAEISDNENGTTVSVIGNSITIPDNRDSSSLDCLRTLLPLNIRAAGRLFSEAAEEISEYFSGGT